MTQDTNPKLRRTGVVTTAPVKERFRVELARLLRCDAIHFADPFVSTNPDARGAVVDQLSKYRLIVTEGDEKKGPKFHLSGKGFGQNDDLALVVQMLTYWPSTFFSDPQRCLI
jgi:hypothetical protein